MAVMQQVSDAVVRILETGEAAGTFSKSILTERRWFFLKDLEDLDGISVQVVPVGSVRERESNSTWIRYVRVDVLCKKRVPQSEIEDGLINREWIDGHVAMLEEIDDYLAGEDTTVRDPVVGMEYIEPGDKRVPGEIIRKLGVEFYEEEEMSNI